MNETLAVNAAPIQVRVLDGATQEPLADETLTADSAPLEVTIPADGWYILEKSVVGNDASIGILAVKGIYPIIERNFLRTTTNADSGTDAQRIYQYVRVTDNWQTEATGQRSEAKGR